MSYMLVKRDDYYLLLEKGIDNEFNKFDSDTDLECLLENISLRHDASEYNTFEEWLKMLPKGDTTEVLAITEDIPTIDYIINNHPELLV